jgi:hypothetical protein
MSRSNGPASLTTHFNRSALARLAALSALVAVTTGQAAIGGHDTRPAAAVATASPAPGSAALPASDMRPEANVIKGTVRTANGRPLAGAKIRIAGNTGVMRSKVIEATTDRNGVYRAQVPLGHYNVDGFLEVRYAGEVYKELWLDRTDGSCERVMSDRGLVRHFQFRLTGLKRCINNPDPELEASYYGAHVNVSAPWLPADARVTFTLTPRGPLADGSTGRAITMTRTGAELMRSGGSVGANSALHDIPLGQYRLAASVRYANGTQQPLQIQLRDEGRVAGEAADIVFRANQMFPFGFRAVSIGLVEGRAAPPPPTPNGPPHQDQRNVRPPAPDHGGSGGGLPAGSYACFRQSQYVGPIPTGSITILAGGRYRTQDGLQGDYSHDATANTVRWISGPFADGRVTAQLARGADGQPVFRVTPAGGGSGEVSTCVLR